MATADQPNRSKWLWELVSSQDGVLHQDQLLSHGLTETAIRHRVAKGRLYPKWPGVFAVGRRDLSQRGLWIGALLTCGPEAALSNGSAMAYFGLGIEERGIEVCVPRHVQLRRGGITLHRRRNLEQRHIAVDGPIRVTNPVLTLIDFAAHHDRDDVEQATNDADRQDVIDPERVRLLLDDYQGWNGARVLREILDIRTFTMTDSELERRMRPIVRRVGLSKPLTQHWLNGYKVDFYWPDIGLVVETDGLRYHRTAAQQAKDRIRDQTHTAAGLIPLRFTRWQVRYDPKPCRGHPRRGRKAPRKAATREARPPPPGGPLRGEFRDWADPPLL